MDTERPNCFSFPEARKTDPASRSVKPLATPQMLFFPERRNTRSLSAMTTDAAGKAVILKLQRLLRQWKNATTSSPSLSKPSFGSDPSTHQQFLMSVSPIQALPNDR